MENEAKKPIGLAEAADSLDIRIHEHPLVVEWANKYKTSDPIDGVYNDADVLNVVYREKAIECGFFISTRTMQARVLVRWPFRTWQYGIEDADLTATIHLALTTVEFLWNHHIAHQTGMYPNTIITIEK